MVEKNVYIGIQYRRTTLVGASVKIYNVVIFSCGPEVEIPYSRSMTLDRSLEKVQ
jgi:hypothetical protein